MMVISLAAVTMLSFVNRYGVHTSAAYGAASQLWTYVQMPAMALGAAVSSMAAQNVGAGKMDSNDMVAKLKPILANLPNLHASIDKLAAAVGGGSGNAKGVAGPKPISTVGKGQYRVGSTPPGKGGFKAVDQAAQSMGKAEGIPSAPKAPGSSLPAAAKASATQAVKTSPAAPTSATKL